MLRKLGDDKNDADSKKPSATMISNPYGTTEGRKEISKLIAEQLTSSKEEKEEKAQASYESNIVAVTEEINKLFEAKDLDFSEIILQLVRSKDAHDGIPSTLDNKLIVEGRECRFLSRDAREQPPEGKLNPYNKYEGWASMGLNFILAADKLIDFECQILDKKTRTNAQAHKKELFNKLAKNFYHEIKDNKNPQKVYRTMVHNVLIPKLEEFSRPPYRLTGLKNPGKKLGELRDFANFELPNLTIATQVRIKDNNGKENDFTRIDVPMAGGFTGLLEKEYALLAKYDRSQNTVDRKTLEQIPWFQTLRDKPHIQALIIQNAQKILNGNVIPTQLRKYIPGIRNARQGFLYNEQGKEIYSGYFAATLAHEMNHKDISAKATEGSYEQLISLMAINEEASYLRFEDLFQKTVVAKKEAEKVVDEAMKDAAEADFLCPRNKHNELYQKYHGNPFIISLINDPIPPFALNERDLTKQVEDTVTDSTLIQLPTQFYRVIGGTNIHGIDELLTDARTLANRLKHHPHLKERGHKLGKILDEIKRCQKMSVWRGENPNFHIAALLPQLFYLCGLTSVEGCKSAKDRAGSTEESSYEKAITLELNLDTVHQLEAENRLLRASSTKLLAGGKGSSIGCFGTLGSFSSGTPDSLMKNRPTLNEETASYNKDRPTTAAPLYKTRLFIIAMTIVGIALCVSGVGAAVGIPLLTSIGVATAGGFFSMGAASACYSIFKTHNKSGLKKGVQIFLGLFAVAFGVSLCLSGAGAAAGIPILASVIPWVTGLTTAATGGTIATMTTTGACMVSAATALEIHEKIEQNKIQVLANQLRDGLPSIKSSCSTSAILSDMTMTPEKETKKSQPPKTPKSIIERSDSSESDPESALITIPLTPR